MSMETMPESRQNKLEELYEYGRSKGVLTYKEIMDRLMEVEMDAEQLDKVLETLEAYGISVVNDESEAHSREEEAADIAAAEASAAAEVSESEGTQSNSGASTNGTDAQSNSGISTNGTAAQTINGPIYYYGVGEEQHALTEDAEIVLTYKAQEDAIIVLEDFSFEAPKTKEFVKIAKNLKVDGKKLLLLLPDTNKNVYLSARNLQKALVLEAAKVNTYQVMNADVLIVTEKSLETIGEILNK
mgnify:CR=1 FL=1